MKQLGEDARQANDAAAVTCYNARVTCENSCDDLATKYDTLVDNCSGCSSRTVYESAAQDLRSNARSCASLSSFDAAAMQQAVSGSQSGGAGNACEEVSAASPSNSGGGSGSSGGGAMNQASASPNACAMNPNGPGCATPASATTSRDASTATTSGASATAGGSLDVGDTTGFTSEPTFGSGGYGSGDNTPKVKPIANNSGGGIPGGAGGGGGGNGGIQGGNGAGGLFGAARPSVDIEQGLRSGGYSAPGGSGLEDPDGAEALAKAGGGVANAGGRTPTGMDLKDYLPGGRLSANGIHTGSILPIVREIGGPHVDLWSRISQRMQLMCKLGQLYDCK